MQVKFTSHVGFLLTQRSYSIVPMQFTPEGVIPIRGFLSAHLHTVKHLSLKELITNGSSPSGVDAFVTLAKVFQSSGLLETLNLSDNNLQVSQIGSIWENWASHTRLRQLILDYVAMDDSSVKELASNFTFGDSLEELYVVLTKNIGARGLDAANEILKRCRKVSSLRWAVRDAPPTAKLPWYGLAQMAECLSSKGTQSSTLVHLVMDGGTITQSELNYMYSAFQYFSALKTVKLRSVGLLDEGAMRLSEALLASKPPLENLDLSRNDIRTTGAVSIARLSKIDNIAKHLSVLALDRNRIDMGGARTVLEAFGSSGDPKLDVRLDGNPFHYGKLALNLACRKGQAENERNEMQKEVDRIQLNMLDAASYDTTRVLQEEVTKLRDEKKALVAAFSIIGASGGMENQSSLKHRIACLEKRVFGLSTDHSGARSDSFERRRSSTSLQDSNLLGGRAAVHLASLLDSEEQASPTASLSGRSTVSSSTLKKMSPTSTPLMPVSPRRTMRDNMRDLVSPLALNTRNSVAVGPWVSSPNSKKGISSGTTTWGHQNSFGSPPRFRDCDDASVKTSQSRMTTRSDPITTENRHQNERDLHFTPSAYH